MKVRAMVLGNYDPLRTLVSYILKDRGYEVYAYSDPFLSPVYCDSERSCPEENICPNIIITDNEMPNMTGFEFIEYQKSKGCKVQNIAIISGRWTNENIKHAKRLGCQIFEKPFKLDEVKKWLDECEKELGHSRN